MKKAIKYIALFCLGISANAAHAQDSCQSAIYDAIAIFNATHGQGAIILPGVQEYNNGPVHYVVINSATGAMNRNATADDPSIKNSQINADTARKLILQIMARNAGLPISTTETAILARYKDNPFLNTVPDFAVNKETFAGSDGMRISPNSGGLGGPAATVLKNVANGTADFLIKRSGEEISISIFAKLQKFIEHYPELGVLFPRTTGIILPVSPYDYNKTLAALKEAVQGDLDELGHNVPSLYYLSRYKDLNEEVPAMTLMFTAVRVVDDLQGGNGLSRTLHDIDTSAFMAAQNNYASFVHLSSKVSDALRKKSAAEPDTTNFPYISMEDINGVTRSSEGRLASIRKAQLASYFLGLLYQQCKDIPIWTKDSKTSAGVMLKELKDQGIDVSKIFGDLMATSGKLKTFSDKLNNIKDEEKAKSLIQTNPFTIERFQLYNDLLLASMDLCKPFVAYGKPSPAKKEFALVCEYWPPFSASGINMAKAISQKNYNLAVNELSEMLVVVSKYMEAERGDRDYARNLKGYFKAKTQTTIDKVNSTIAVVNTKLHDLDVNASTDARIKAQIRMEKQMLGQELAKLETQKSELQWQKKHADKALFAIGKVIEYINLFAAVSQAGNSKEVEAILEAYALPAGSSRIKKDAAFEWAVGAYVGGFFGRDTKDTGFSNRYGFSAPIGLTLSHGFGKAGSISGFLGAFDLGGVIKYKLDNNGAYQQDIDLMGLIAPNISAVYGLPFYLPVSIGVGYQWVYNKGAANITTFTPHFNAFAGVDIPLFDIYVKKKGMSHDRIDRKVRKSVKPTKDRKFLGVF